MKKVVILGSTGSIGVQALEVISKNMTKYKVIGLAAGNNTELLLKQIEEFKPKVVAALDEEGLKAISEKHKGIDFNVGQEGIKKLAVLKEADIVINGIMGVAGLAPTYEALRHGKKIAFANKETLVSGGNLIMDAKKRYGGDLIPVDSEHCAIFQCMYGSDKYELSKVYITGSGGPFLDVDKKALRDATPEQAIAHPIWSMGKKISVDSATLMNKGLEVIEAKWLFDLEPEQIEVLIHPEGLVHSMVEFIDGQIIANLGVADMKIPIAFALSYPARNKNMFGRVNFLKEGSSLTFRSPDLNKFGCLKIALDALDMGSSYPAFLNRANEILVQEFLNGNIYFTQIGEFLEKLIDAYRPVRCHNIMDVINVGTVAERATQTFLKEAESQGILR